MKHDVGQRGNSGPDEFLADGKGKQTGILTEQEQMQQAGLAGGLADQVLMAAGEGIGIHDDGSDWFRWIGRSG